MCICELCNSMVIDPLKLEVVVVAIWPRIFLRSYNKPHMVHLSPVTYRLTQQPLVVCCKCCETRTNRSGCANALLNNANALLHTGLTTGEP